MSKIGEIANFTDFYFCLDMRFLTSNLLHQGLSPKQIIDAVIRVLTVGKSSGMNIREHFMPVFSGVDGEIIRNCKLARLKYGSVLMNAEKKLSVVGK